VIYCTFNERGKPGLLLQHEKEDKVGRYLADAAEEDVDISVTGQFTGA